MSDAFSVSIEIQLTERCGISFSTPASYSQDSLFDIRLGDRTSLGFRCFTQAIDINLGFCLEIYHRCSLLCHLPKHFFFPFDEI